MYIKRILQTAAVAGFCTLLTNAHAQVSTDSLILHLPMNGDAADISGNGNNGTPINVVPAEDRFGSANGAYSFNGSSATIEIPASPTINKIQAVDEITITAWVKRKNVTADVFAILERYNPALDASYILELNTYLGGIAFVGNPAAPSPLITCNYANWNVNQWYHVAFSYSKTAGLAKFYVDGVSVCSVPYTIEIDIADSTASFWVGRSLTGPDEYSNGLMDDLKVYYRALSDVEIVTSAETEKQLKNRLTVYPNPAKESVNLDHLPAGAKVILTDLAGKEVNRSLAKGETLNLSTKELDNGIYFIRVESQGFSAARKLIIRK